MTKKLALFTLFCILYSMSANAQSEYKKWVKEETKDKTYSKREVKRATKDYAALIYENSEEIFEEREDYMKSSPKKRDKQMKEEFTRRIKDYRTQRYRVENTSMPTLENQLMEEIRMAWSYDSQLFPVQIEGESKCTGKNYEMAVDKALELAKVNVANEIVREVTLQFAKKDFVKEFGLDKSQEMTQAILDSKDMIVELIENVNKVVEVTNSKNKASVEVMVKVFYSGNKAKENFKVALADVLKDEPSLYNEMVNFFVSDKNAKKKKK